MKIEQYITQTYSSIRYKSKRRGDKIPLITKIELRKWLFENGLEKKWIRYIESNFDKKLKPSIDRIDDYGVYEFSNMQLITWYENNKKGSNGLKHHRNSKNKNLQKPCIVIDKDGISVKFESRIDAAIYLKCHITSISRAITGKRKTIKKYNVIDFALTGEELTIINK